MKPYLESRGFTVNQENFNQRLSHARIYIANGLENSRQDRECSLKKSNMHHVFLKKIVQACVVLHNVCEKYNKFYDARMKQVKCTPYLDGGGRTESAWCCFAIKGNLCDLMALQTMSWKSSLYYLSTSHA